MALVDKNFTRLGGLDYRSHDVDRKDGYASEVNNVEYLSNNSWGLRKGFQGYAKSKGGGGTKNYVHLDPATQAAIEELVTIDSNLWRLKEGTITITYAGATDQAYLEIAPAQNTDGSYSFHAYLTQGDVTSSDTLEIMTESGDEILVAESYVSTGGVADIDLGIGVEENPFYTVAELVAAIDASSVFVASATGDTSGAAAFIGSGLFPFISNVATIPYHYWEQIYCPISNPFSAFAALLGTDNQELACLFNHSQRLFIATGKTSLYKYDSLQVFRAGMPTATTLSATLAAPVGAGLTGTYRYQITYEQIDALGISVEGNPSNEVEITPSGDAGSVTIPTIQPTTGFLTSCATVNGNQSSTTTITVTAGHTLQVGQTVYFRDASGNETVRTITAKGSTTITISGTNVNVNTGEVISANLRINLWRNKSGGSEKYLVKTFANKSLSASISFHDEVADDDLGAQMEFITTEHGLPPDNLKYLTSYIGLLIGSKGDDRVYFNFVSDPENFDTANSSFSIRSKSNMPVRGAGATRDILCVFKENETHLVQGDDFWGGSFSVQLLADKIGCSSHHSIIDVQGTIWFYSADFGVRRVYQAQIPDDVGYRISPRTTLKPNSQTLQVVNKRVIAFDVPRAEQAIFYFPCENTSPSVYPNENSFCLVANYKNQFDSEYTYDENGRILGSTPRVSWWRWTELNMGGGGDIYKGELFWTEKRYSSTVGNIEYPLIRRYEYTDPYIFMDHAQPIALEYQTHWVTKGEPDVQKKYIQAVIYCFPPDSALGFSIYCQTEINYINDIAHSKKLLNFGEGGVSFGWGTWDWGLAPWGEDTVPLVIFPFKPTRAKALKLKFYNTFWNVGAVISGWDIEIVPVYKIRVKP